MALPAFKFKPIVQSISLVLISSYANAATVATQLPRIDVVSDNEVYNQAGSYDVISKEEIELLQPLST